MEKQMKRVDKEYMKMAMLKQEETFRHQVHELHRLYRVQKLLMRDMKNAEAHNERSTHEETNCEIWNAENKLCSYQPCMSYLDQRQPCRTPNFELTEEKHIGNSAKSIMEEADEEGDLELTLAIGSSRRQRKAKEASLTSDSGSSFSSSSTESAALKPNSGEWGLIQMPGVSMRFINERKSGFDVEERMRQDGLKQQPPWLFQCLSLNIT